MKPNNKPTLEQAAELLQQLICEVDEDCPYENRTRHLTECMEECGLFLSRYRNYKDKQK